MANNRLAVAAGESSAVVVVSCAVDRAYGPVAEHCMIVLKPKVPRCRLNWSLSCTVNAPSMMPAMNTVVAMVMRSDIGPRIASTLPELPTIR
jgi:hypothetical protein